jgi:thiosulfate/3-mercaptopyruvate sulfurtransferase
MNPLVNPAWLAERVCDPNLRILDATLPPVGVTPKVDTRGRYVERRLPGAAFFDIEEFSDHATSLPHMLPSAEEFSRKLGALGVGDGNEVVVYEQEGVFSAPRAWWMLRVFGAKKVYLLDGGLRGWIEAGYPVESGEVKRSPAEFHAALDREAVKSFEQVNTLIADRGQILDARSAARFSGEAAEPRPRLSSGHMPGAVSLPFTDLAADGRLKPAEELRAIFAAKGVTLDKPVTTTCGSGVTAAVLALGLEIAGAREVSLYDGSWAEYAQHPDAVIAKGV